MTDATGITILGATGYTGRLCAAEAVARGLDVTIAGRRRPALEALAEQLPGPVSIAVADTADAASLASLAGATGVLLTAVGPYERLGRPVFDAAVAQGCGYLDVSGEVPFLSWVHDQAERAEAAGIAACPGVGFDGVPGDLLAAVAAATLDGAVTEARSAYLIRNGRVTAGTARSALGIAAQGGGAWVDGRLVAEPALSHRWRAPFPSPERSRDTVSVPLPEAVTLGRSTGARVARAYMAVPAAGLLPAVSGVLARAGGLAVRTPLWDAAEALVDRMPEGPSETTRRRAEATVLSMVRSGDRTARAWARVDDVYGTTATIAVAYARRMLDGAVASGVHTPSSAAAPHEMLDLIATDWGTG